MTVCCITEVQALIYREVQIEEKGICPYTKGNEPDCTVEELWRIAAWLVVNSMRSEQTQWNMLCVQNVSNIYRKNAFGNMLSATAANVVQLFQRVNHAVSPMLKPKSSRALPEGCADVVAKRARIQNIDDVDEVTDSNVKPDSISWLTSLAQSRVNGDLASLDPRNSLKVFDEPIDFSLEAAVPDPVPFVTKLQKLLTLHRSFLLHSENGVVAQHILAEVGDGRVLDESAQSLETEQEREQEVEIEKEVQQRRDQQVEVEKFIQREYSRFQEEPTPWPLSMLTRDAQSSLAADQHPFFPLHKFRLRHQRSLQFPDDLQISRNYYNPDWTGLRRPKNVIMVLEWVPIMSRLALVTSDSQTELSPAQEAALQKAFWFLSGISGSAQSIAHDDVIWALRAASDAVSNTAPETELLTRVLAAFGHHSNGLTYSGFKALLLSKKLQPKEKGRYFVGISLAEAETLRRVLHLQHRDSPFNGETQFALRFMSSSSPGGSQDGFHVRRNDNGVLFDATAGWCRGMVPNTGVQAFQLDVARHCMRFFDCDMYYSESALRMLVMALQASTLTVREQFFQSVTGCRRRAMRKWEETPLATVFTLADEWAVLKMRAISTLMRRAITQRQLSLWESFLVFDSNADGALSGAELFGALRWLGALQTTAEDVVDVLHVADRNQDGLVDYREYRDFLRVDGVDVEDDVKARVDMPPKVQPYGVEEVRTVTIQRQQAEIALRKEVQMERVHYQQLLDLKLFEEELLASASRPGGANPCVQLYLNSDGGKQLESGAFSFAAPAQDTKQYVITYSFMNSQLPLRTVTKGRCELTGAKKEAKVDVTDPTAQLLSQLQLGQIGGNARNQRANMKQLMQIAMAQGAAEGASKKTDNDANEDANEESFIG
jgi:hypothetical protein